MWFLWIQFQVRLDAQLMHVVPDRIYSFATSFALSMFTQQQLISCSADLQQSSSAGAAVSIRPPPKAAAKGPAKQVSDKKAAEYAKLEDQLFEL